jgi:hypothetical protein
MKAQRVLAWALAAAVVLPAMRGSAANDPLAKWFGSRTCAALNGLYSDGGPPAVKTGSDDLLVHIPDRVLPLLKESMTVPWYVYDPKLNAAFSHIGIDSGVVETLREVAGPPPVSIPSVDLGSARTKSGIKLGDGAASVVQKLGKPHVVRACGMERYEYDDTSDPNAQPNDLDFTIRSGRVIEIVHTSWG